MAKAVFDNLSAKTPKNHFTVGITDDVTGASLKFDGEPGKTASQFHSEEAPITPFRCSMPMATLGPP
jgi:hypothetical protein